MVHRAVVYSRVSTDAQERDGTSLDTQERACLEHAKGWLVVAQLRDTASGASLDRPGIERLRQLLRQGAVDVVVAYAVDRLSRNQNHIGILFDEVEQTGAKLEFVTENFEASATGRFILAARAFIGEVEREKIAERTMRGKAERARSGKLPQGTGRGCYGYVYNKGTGQRDLVSAEAIVVRLIFAEFCAKASCHGIATRLNQEGVPAFGGGLWHPLTIRRMLQNETYTGRTIYRRTRVENVRDLQTSKRKRRVIELPQKEWIDVPGATPKIIDLITFDRAQAILSDPARRLQGQPTRRYRLRGHLRCLTCGTPMVGQTLGSGRYRYYRCRRSYAGRLEGKCPSKYVKVDVLEQTVLEQIAQLLSDPRRILSEAQRLNQQGVDQSRLCEVNGELKQIEVKQRRLAKLYLEGSIPEDILSFESRPLAQRRERLESELKDLLQSPKRGLNPGDLEENLPVVAARLRKWVLDATDEDLDLILKALSVQIKASQEEVHIEGIVPILPEEDQYLVTIVQTSGCMFKSNQKLESVPFRITAQLTKV